MPYAVLLPWYCNRVKEPQKGNETTFDNLSAEQKKFGACRTPEEVLEIAKAEGYQLSDEELSNTARSYPN